MRSGEASPSDLKSRPSPPNPPQRTGVSAQFALSHLGNHIGSATQLCVGTEISPSRSARTVLGQQANFAPRVKARAWCSLQVGGELLAAKASLRGGGWHRARIDVETLGHQAFTTPSCHAAGNDFEVARGRVQPVLQGCRAHKKHHPSLGPP